MTDVPKVGVTWRKWAQESKRHMVIFGALGFGVPMWLMEIWIAWDFMHTFSWILFLGAVSIGGGMLWGWGMWHANRFIQRNKKS